MCEKEEVFTKTGVSPRYKQTMLLVCTFQASKGYFEQFLIYYDFIWPADFDFNVL